MATIYRALATAILVLYAYVVATGVAIGEDPAALGWHLQVGLIAAIAGCLVNSVPFAYFLGTGFWVKAFVRASRAGPEWVERHDQWMKGKAYLSMYLAAFFPAGVAITGGLVETNRIASFFHPIMVGMAVVAQLMVWVRTPREMVRNSALMDELADKHQVPKPGTPSMEQLIEEEEQEALPPLFQLSRILMLVGSNLVILWSYLRFGTENWRGVSLLPFGLGCALLVAIGVGLNARFDPNTPLPSSRAWTRAFALGLTGIAVTVGLVQLGA
jgi:hypothetical protein